MIKVGKIEVSVDTGGYPAWCRISIEGEHVASLHHSELSDMIYAMEKAQIKARSSLPDKYKDEILMRSSK